jgi:GNAT superfamily N-acetyltransferase
MRQRTALFAEDAPRDRLRDPQWPSEHGAAWIAGLRRKGVGSGLVAEFTKWARERGATRWHVTAYTANDAAVRFYQRHGYVPLSTVLAADL